MKKFLVRLGPTKDQFFSLLSFFWILCFGFVFELVEGDDWNDDKALLAGLLLGAILGSYVWRLVVSYFRLRLITVVLLFVGLIWGGFFDMVESFLSGTNFDSWSDFWGGMVVGAIWNCFIFFLISQTHTPLVPIVLFWLLINLEGTHYDSDDNFSFLWVDIGFILVALIIVAAYTVNVYNVSRLEVRRNVGLRTWFVLAGALLVSLVVGWWLNEYFEGGFHQRDVDLLPGVVVDSEGGRNFDDISLDLRPVIVGTYQADEPLYLKNMVFEVRADFDGLTVEEDLKPWSYDWFESHELLQEGDGKPEEVAMVYELNKGDPFASPLSLMSFDDLRYSDSLGLLKPSSDEGGHYAIDFVVVRGYSPLENEVWVEDYVVIDEESQRYEEIAVLAKEIVGDLEDPRLQAEAIESYLVENYWYSLSPGIEDKANPIDDFLLDSKVGYCTYFATSMAYLLETLGVESRVVGGFYSDFYDEGSESYWLLASDLHAWTEVYIPQEGWVEFEPTTYRLDGDISSSNLVTGGNRQFSINYEEPVFDPVDPIFSFEDIYDAAVNDESFDFDDFGEIEYDEPLQEEDENSVSRWNDFLWWLRNGLLVLLAVMGVFVLGLVGWRLWNNVKWKEGFYWSADERLARRIDKNIRKKFVKRYEIGSQDFYKISSKQFVKFLEQEKGVEVDSSIKEIYDFINVILYSRSYDKRVVDELRDLARQVDI